MKSKKPTKDHQSRVRNIVPILGVNVDSTSRASVLMRTYNLLERRGIGKFQPQIKPVFIITPNPEIVYRASLDLQYAAILNKAQQALVDGVGLAWAVRIAQVKLTNPFTAAFELVFQSIGAAVATFLNLKKEVVPGRVFFEELIKIAQQKKLRVFLLGGQSRVAERTASKIEKRGVEVASNPGPWLDNHGEPVSSLDEAIEAEVIKKINDFKPHLLFVAFGPPKQEFWLAKNLDKLEVGAGVGVGGTFDYFSGERPFPPSFLSSLGLEWFWRLVTQPWRVGRIFTAVVLFPAKVLLEKLKEN